MPPKHSDTDCMLRKLKVRGLWPRYIDLLEICTFCFDNLATLREHAGLYRNVKTKHIQLVLHLPSPMIFCRHSGSQFSSGPADPAEYKRLGEYWREKEKEWAGTLDGVDEACRQVQGLETLLLSVHPETVYWPLANERKVLESMERVMKGTGVRVLGEVWEGNRN